MSLRSVMCAGVAVGVCRVLLTGSLLAAGRVNIVIGSACMAVQIACIALLLARR